MAGFTLIELLVALTLLALMASVLFGSLSLASRSLEGGERKVGETSGMRLGQEFLRAQLEAAHPLRLRKVAEYPLLFVGERDELRFAAALPARVSGGGLWYYRLAIGRDGDRAPLILERAIPDVNALDPPDFRDAERSVLASDVSELRVQYFGRDPGSSDTVAPTWRDQWDDKHQLPLMLKVDVKPKEGSAWPSLYVSPHQGPEAGCRAWDPGRQRCASP